MAVGTPDNTQQVEDRIKADVQREAPDSNPYLRVSWLRSLIAGVARRIFDFYQDLRRTETRLFPDTADSETSLRWGQIYVGPKNPATSSSGRAVSQGVSGASITIGTLLTANGNEYVTLANATISDTVLDVISITRTGTTATVTTAADHLLASSVPVSITGADQAEYNVTDTEIVVIDSNQFTFQVAGSPVTPATGTIEASFTSASVQIESVDFGSDKNLDLDTPLKLQSPIVNVSDTLHVDFGAIGGGSDEESTDAYKNRYLDKIRNPVAHFNANDIIATAKNISGVTRVFVEESGDIIGSITVASLTRLGNVAKVVTPIKHGYDDGMTTSILGADQSDYNVINERIIIEDAFTFYYVVLGSPTSPATGTITASVNVPLGQCRVFFMRDNDPDPIPTDSEVAQVKAELDKIRPANTSTNDLIVKAPEPILVDFVLTQLTPNTPTMRESIEANLAQFFEEQTSVSKNVDEDAYRSSIINTVDISTGETVETFELSTPIGDIIIGSGEIAILGSVTFPTV